MILVLDAGNTCVTIGVFEGDNLIDRKHIASNPKFLVEEYVSLIKEELGQMCVEKCAIASVVRGLDIILGQAIERVYGVKPTIYNPNMNLPIKVCTKTVAEVGADRIANVLAVLNNKKKPIIIVDMGTAITFDVVGDDNSFRGGLIMPGLSMQLKALADNTSLLPLVEIQECEKVIANNTKDAILAGVVRATACAISGMIKETENELGEKATLIATGGYAEFLCKYIEQKFDEINKNLTLCGVKRLLDFV